MSEMSDLAIRLANARAGPVPVEELEALLRDSLRPHYHCDDSWYCCALCDNEDHGELDGHGGEAARTAGVCNCGAEAWNERVRAMLARLEGVPR